MSVFLHLQISAAKEAFLQYNFPVFLAVCGHSAKLRVKRFIVRNCSESKLTVIFGICMILSPGVPIFITLGRGVHENRQSYMGLSKYEIWVIKNLSASSSF